MKIKVSDDAISDLARGADFYESIRAGLGVYFNDCLASDIDSLLLYAGIHASEDGWFYTMSQRFPYVIWYAIEGDLTTIYAVLDARVDPIDSEQRLRERRK